MKKVVRVFMFVFLVSALILGNISIADVSAAKKSKKVIVIDPGHQKKANLDKEPIGPGSKTKKYKVAGGTSGESSTNLAIAKKLRAELEKRGYKVYMTRTSQDVNISNKERAQYANKKKADAVIHIHCDAGSKSTKGAHTIAPASTKFVSSSVKKKSQKLAKKVINSYCEKTKIKNRGVSKRDDLTGLNWSKVPAIYIECGFLTNKSEKKKLKSSKFQKKMAVGMANGIDDYFGK